MPTYDYECKVCGHHFEVFQSMSDTPLKTCRHIFEGMKKGDRGCTEKG